MTKAEAEYILMDVFKIDHFYDTQWLIIEKILNGERVLLIEKTGYGKSLCFQFPALLFDGLTIVFTPLIALMRDQVSKLTKLGINAKCINSNQDSETNSLIIQEALNNEIKILYIAPERMENIEWINSARQMKISMIVVDEAHCISTWGHDFRPAYKRIVALVNLLPESFPVLATTATATKIVEDDIKNQIGNNIYSFRGNLLRENFRLFVIKVESEEEKFIWLAQKLNDIPGNGLIYTGTKANTVIFSNWLNFAGINSTFYNADIDSETREEIEKGLLENRWKCIVTTNALGMGIDKPDIRFIIHTQIPVSPIHYYQEIGRAGRDGKKTFIILFYNPKEDNNLPQAFIEGSKPSATKYQKVIESLKHERMGLHNIMKATNLKQTEIQVIKSDLIEQKIINEVFEGRNKLYEIRFNAPEFNQQSFIEIKNQKLKEFSKMLDYIDYHGCRMNYLCNYLGDNTNDICNKCDNDTNHIVQVEIDDYWRKKSDDFHYNYFPVLEVANSKNNLIDGVAASYYGFSNVGKIIHKCKYENGGDFPEHLFNLSLKAYHKKFKNLNFNLILYVPPTESGNLVRNFARKFSDTLRIPISHNLTKLKETKPQKIFQNSLLKKENIQNVFIYEPTEEIIGKAILLIDDIFDSGATIKEIGKYLTSIGAALIAPLVIAKTVGGDLK
ncbi:MAG: ATP-dependent helicase RecQ [Bacteroidota bacterium]|nr:ATP-dependent helicase RecQ [Bacteroidota bacterium]